MANPARLLGALAALALFLVPSAGALADRDGVVYVDGLTNCVDAVVVGTEPLAWRIDRHIGATTTSFTFSTTSPGGAFDRCIGPDCGVVNDPIVTVDLWAKGVLDDDFKLVRHETVPCAP
jgi:hypothetical protein